MSVFLVVLRLNSSFSLVLNEGSIQLAQRLASIAVAVIQAIGRPEFEDGLRTGVLQEDCWCPCGVRTKPLVNARAPMWQGMTLGACGWGF